MKLRLKFAMVVMSIILCVGVMSFGVMASIIPSTSIANSVSFNAPDNVYATITGSTTYAENDADKVYTDSNYTTLKENSSNFKMWQIGSVTLEADVYTHTIDLTVTNDGDTDINPNSKSLSVATTGKDVTREEALGYTLSYVITDGDNVAYGESATVLVTLTVYDMSLDLVGIDIGFTMTLSAK